MLITKEVNNLERALLDYGGEVNSKVDYEILPGGGGITLRGFELDEQQVRVREILRYRPWNFGKINPGAGQMGIYRLEGEQGQEQVALIKDYRAGEGDWRIWLMDLAPTERAMKEKLMLSPHGLVFGAYLWD